MTKPKFTPGPWHAHHGAYEPDYVFFGEEENCDTERRVIAEVYQRVGFRSYDVDLIAAAPEMYALLQKQCAVCPGAINQEMTDMYDCRACEIGKVLRKAMGESEVSND
jgi:hypothetical protein